MKNIWNHHLDEHVWSWQLKTKKTLEGPNQNPPILEQKKVGGGPQIPAIFFKGWKIILQKEPLFIKNGGNDFQGDCYGSTDGSTRQFTDAYYW